MAFLRCKDPVRGSTRDVALNKPLVTIGRKRGNDVVLDDPHLAPTHAQILRKGGTYTISTVGAARELYVDGEPVRKATLREGDAFQLGRFELRLLPGRPEAEATPDRARHAVEAMERLVEFSGAVMREENPERLFKLLLEAVVELTGAEKGFVLVLRDNQRQLAASHNVGRETLDISRVSDTIVDQVIKLRRPVIVSDAMNDRKFARARSVVDLKVTSVMCVPLLYRNDLLGVLYLGNDAVTGLFTEDDLAILQVWASQASMVMHAAIMLNELKVTNRNLREALRRRAQGSMIGSSRAMREVFRVLRRVAPTDISVLVLGETGTGKELVAREIHRLSPRKKGPFISINCGAIPENLLESELFGHKKGAFTGAIADKVGKFEAAGGGTIFLDEIGEMPMNLQVKLLRVLQERAIERVGDLKPRPVDIRVVAATNKDLAAEIEAGRFREDLYYRLNEVSIQLPPLRERGEDIHELARFFLHRYAEQYGSRARGFTNECVRAMLNYYWPGNVRQLENRIKKAVIMSDRALLNADDLGIPAHTKREILPLDVATENFKKNYIREALDLNNWNKAETARDLGVDPRTIFRYIEKLEDA